MKIAKTNVYRNTSKIIDKERLNQTQLKRLDQDLGNVFEALKGRIRFGTGTSGDRGENISGEFLDITTNATPDTEDAFSHTLGSVPIGYIVIGRDKAGVIYDGTTAWTSTSIYLRSDVATVAAKVFLLK